MSRRPFALFALSFSVLAISACSDTTAPTPAAANVRQIQPSGQASFDVTDPGECRGGYLTGSGRAC
jgi:ABC-type oligopeptide transport system substrate-binding subunit